MAGEKAWAKRLAARLQRDLASTRGGKGDRVTVEPARRLLYAHGVMRYDGPNSLVSSQPFQAGYETDVLIADVGLDGSWTPRVVVETKLGQISTHDALTYSTKAWTHRHVHPYLRYGVLVGGLGGPLPLRLLRHGAHFDFMLVWPRKQPAEGEMRQFVRMLKHEIRASRRIGAFLGERSPREREQLRMIHRKVEFERVAQ